MKYFSEQILGDSAPSIEQGEEYIELLQDTVRSIGRDVVTTRRFPGKAFYLPGGLTEWSTPDTQHHTHIEHDRHYSGLVRYIGDGARKLCVLEMESWFRPKTNEYYSERNMYRMTWDARRVTDAQVLKQEIFSRANNIAIALPRGFRDDMVFEIAEDAGSDDDLISFRYADIDAMTEAGMFALYDRTQEFQRDIADARGIRCDANH